MKLSFVIPAHNEQETLRPLVEGILEHAAPREVQIVLIDDGSTDDSRVVMAKLAEEHENVSLIAFDQNGGKTAALAAGFREATGDVVFTMDADLQDDPKEIPQFIAKMEQGWDLVCGWKEVRHDPWHKTFPSKIYNGCIKRLFNVQLNDVNCGYKAMRREVAESLTLYGDRHRLIPILAVQNGYRATEIAVDHQPRRHGQSKYGIERFVKGAADVFTLWFLSRYRQSPGHFFIAGAIGAFLAGIVFALFAAASDDARIFWTVLAAGCIGGAMAWKGLAFLAELLVALDRERK